MDVVVGQNTSIVELLSGENETLLVWRDGFFVLNLTLQVLNSVSRLHVESDDFLCQSFQIFLVSNKFMRNCFKTILTKINAEEAFIMVIVNISTRFVDYQSSF
ncbi:Conserved_hypothetical protein [Hexamita inflata]|uniref:Uncharacterized protein n=1 Tax=Hexamita inflata TaxID=28002 RepID=A0AA86U105_9EUKA|nr:Conserved hypothetical protein [Hexamita inflata]